MNTTTLNSGIAIQRDGQNFILLNIPPQLTPEQAAELAGAIWGGLDPEYAYHCGAVEQPLPYAQFKAKNERLQKLLNRPLPENAVEDPQGKAIHKLSRELGY